MAQGAGSLPPVWEAGVEFHPDHSWLVQSELVDAYVLAYSLILSPPSHIDK